MCDMRAQIDEDQREGQKQFVAQGGDTRCGGTSSSGNMAGWIVFRKTNSPEETIVNMVDECVF